MPDFVYRRKLDKCWNCGFCTETVLCPAPKDCIGCQSCFLACFREAIEPIPATPGSPISIQLDGQEVTVPNQTTVKAALESLGIDFFHYPKSSGHFAPCETGGCYACSVLIDDELCPSCHTAIQPGQQINTQIPEGIRPRRIVGWYTPHPVGGVGTPWTAKNFATSQRTFIEVACFTAGCNLRCRTCQNFDTTYNSQAPAILPEEAAQTITKLRHQYYVKRMAISGGEPTLNRKWLTDYFTELKKLNPDQEARLHLDTNATLLTPDYIDDLVACGVTDIGPDLKAAHLKTYQTITKIDDPKLAHKYLETSWSAVKYIADNYYPEHIFMGVGLPFNEAFYVSEQAMDEELNEWGTRLMNIDEQIQVCILDYRPTFRRRDIQRPPLNQIKWLKKLLEGIGLQTVIAQSQMGHLPPRHPPVDRISSP